MKATDIVNDPTWFLHGVNLDHQVVSFVKTTSASISAASFLDERFDTQSLPQISLGLHDLLALSDSIDAADARFIFHSAFCCSTLLARCLDLTPATVALKEPAVLMALANYQRVGHASLADPVKSGEIYSLIVRLLFRRFESGQSVIVKPTNTVNNIIQPLLAADSNSVALLLHSDLESFLLSILKKGEQGRSFARRLFTIFRMDSREAQQLEMTKLLRMTDAQITAIAWHLQFEHFIDGLLNIGEAQIKTLHCDRLLDRPEETLLSVIEFFRLRSLQNRFEDVMANAPLSHDAKTPDQTYSSDKRKEDYARAKERHADSLNVIMPWARQLHFKHPYKERPGNEL